MVKKLLALDITSNRVFGLDIIRAIAIFYVLLTHSGKFVPWSIMPYYRKFIYDGVGIFFVLSGFLIGGILIKQVENYKFNFSALLYFWIKRWSRTLPNYYLFLLFFIGSNYLLSNNFSFKDYSSYFIFSQNLFSAPIEFFGHSWSLSVEEWFYVSFPLLLLISNYLSPLKFKFNFLIGVISIIVLITVWRFLKIDETYTWDLFRNIIYSVAFRYDSLMFGMLGAFVSYYYPNFWSRNKNLFLIISIMLFIGFFLIQELLPIEYKTYYLRASIFSLTSLTVLFSLPYFSNLRQSKNILVKPLTYLSLISYSVYLVNSVIVEIVNSLINWEGLILFLKAIFQ